MEAKLMRRGQEGATFIEMIFAMAIMLVLTGSFYQLFSSFHQNYELQRMIAEMQQQGRVAVGLISREVRLAGYDPTGAAFDGTKKTKRRVVRCDKLKHFAEPIFEATPTLFHYSVDLNENSRIDNGQPSKPDIDEHIKYEWVGANGVDSCGKPREPYTLFRDSGSGLQEVASNVEFLQFNYFDGSGNLLALPFTTLAERVQIGKVSVTVRSRTERNDPHYDSNGGYRTRQFVSEIWMKNM
jgi:type IV pilus assembly protein PilW